jgi:hypothetical protein
MNAMEERSDGQAPGPGPAEQPAPPHPQPTTQGPPHPTGPASAVWSDRVRAADPRRKSPLLACILSVMPGLGQVYVGYYRLGFIHMAVWGGALALAIWSGGQVPSLLPVCVVFVVFFYLYNVIDAGRRAIFYNQALAGIEGVELPTEMSLPTPGGSVAGGAVLIVVGAVLLTNTLFDMSLAWLEDWWPVGLVLGGAWLVARGVQERRKVD